MSDLSIEGGVDIIHFKIFAKFSRKNIEIKLKPGEAKIIPIRKDTVVIVRRTGSGKNSKIRFVVLNSQKGIIAMGEV